VHRPLWQIFLTLLVLGFVVQRAGAVAFLHLSQGPPALLAGLALQIAAGLATAAGLWLGRRWVIAAIALLGISVVATALLGVYLGVLPAMLAISQTLIAALSTGALVWVLRYELRSEQPRES
jgi:hypothetical protein